MNCLLSDDQLPAAIQLVRSSLPEYYEMAAQHGVDVDAWIAHDLRSPHSELSQYLSIYESEMCCGILCYFSSSELASRQTASLVELMRAQKIATALLPHLRAHAAKIAPLGSDDGLYIARLAVDPAFRGRGIAARMLQQLTDIAAEQGKDRLILHVNSGNVPANRLYQKSGFLPSGASDHRYPLLHKILPS